MGNRYAKSDEHKMIIYLIFKKISMVIRCLNHYLMMEPYLIKKVKFEGVINTFDDSDIGYFVEFDLKILIV